VADRQAGNHNQAPKASAVAVGFGSSRRMVSRRQVLHQRQEEMIVPTNVQMWIATKVVFS
jgi:hypothetical protein